MIQLAVKTAMGKRCSVEITEAFLLQILLDTILIALDNPSNSIMCHTEMYLLIYLFIFPRVFQLQSFSGHS